MYKKKCINIIKIVYRYKNNLCIGSYNTFLRILTNYIFVFLKKHLIFFIGIGCEIE